MTIRPDTPLTFRPLLKPKVWGGRRLERYGKLLPAGELIGESWEVADLPESIPDGRSVIADGPWAGRTLHQVIADDREAIMGWASLSPEGGFPLLIKFLDARENLSVQVHPDEAYAASHPEAHLKSEAWVVLEAEPGAVIYKGVRPGVTREQFERHIRTGEVVADLIAVPAAAGECHYLPSGTCHALGAGVLVAEVQTPSDTTFRVFDWGRTERALHVEQALACMTFPAPSSPSSRFLEPYEVRGFRTTPLCVTTFFSIERLDATGEATLPIVTNGVPVIWIVTRGRGVVVSGRGDRVVRSGRTTFSSGTTLLFPAFLKDAEARFDEPCSVLQVTPPSSTRGMMA